MTESFSMPSADQETTDRPSLAHQIQTSTAQVTQTPGAKIQEVDVKAGISARAKSADEWYQVKEK